MTEVDNFKSRNRFFSYVGLWGDQSPVRKKIGLFVFVIEAASIIIPEVHTYSNYSIR